MKKYLLTVFCLLLLASGLYAGPVTREQALSEATQFLNTHHRQQTQLRLAASARHDLSLSTAESTTPALYYIYNVGNAQGFVIVSGDDRTNPILGYSDEGSFDLSRLSPDMKHFLRSYAGELKDLSVMNDAEASKRLRTPNRAVVSTRNSIAPLITSMWDQATPYWNECPQFMNSDNPDDGYELAYTGCVATAMAQIMYFYKEPAQTEYEIPAYTFTYSNGLGEYGTAYMDALPITSFDWANMRDTYTGAEDEASTSAVAHLMFYIGCAVKMQYGRNSSGAYTDDIPTGFSLFGYGSKIAFRNDYSQQQWDDLVYSELAAGRPMIYNGTAGSGGGHSFVCDGYEYGDYFHINWGWGGMGNGYFQLSILNPSESGIGGSTSSEGYNMKQNIIYNIIPGTGTWSGGGDTPEPEEPALTVTAISGPSGWDRDSMSDPFKIHKSKIIKVSYSDHSGSHEKFKEALALYDPQNETYTIIPDTPTPVYSQGTTSALGQTTKFGDGVNPRDTNMKFGAGMTGTYYIVPMYQLQGTTEWKPMLRSTDYYMEVNMSSYSATATAHPTVDLTATNFSFTGGEKVGVKEQVHVTLQNNSAERFFGDLYLDFGGQQLDEYAQYTTVIQAEIPALSSSTVTFNVTPQTEGNKTVRVMLVDPRYGDFINVPGTGSVTIAPSAAGTMNLSVAIQAENAVGNIIYDSHARFSATVTNNGTGEYNKYVLAPLFIVTSSGASMVTYKQSPLSLAAGQSKTLYFDFDNLAYGSTYALNIYARNDVPDDVDASHLTNIVRPGESVFYDIHHGIVTWDVAGERTGHAPAEGFSVPASAVAVSLEGLSLGSFEPNDNPNTLYFTGDGGSTPASLSGRNVVNDGSAASVVLKDGYDFFTPKALTATTISYERKFTQGHTTADAGWGTIVLPFAATSVTSGGQDIDWHHSSTDSGKPLWMCYFAQEDGRTAIFRDAPQLEANVPYLVAISPEECNKPVVWSAENVVLKPGATAYTSGNSLLFGGTFVKTHFDNLLSMSASGIQLPVSNPVEAFRAAFQSLSGSQPVTILVETASPTTGIRDITTTLNPHQFYTLDGRPVTHPSKGVYIQNGNKVVIK